MAFSNQTDRPVLNATRARSGRPGRPVLWVLLFGTLLAALGLFAAWTWRSGDLASTEPNNGRQPQDARAFDMGEPAAISAPPTAQTAPQTAPAP